MSIETGVIRFSWIDEQMPREDFSEEERMMICYAVFMYRNGEGEEPAFEDRSIRTCWRNIKREIDANVSKYIETCDTNRRNGKKGGRPKTEQNPPKPKKTEKNRKNRTVFSETEQNPPKPKETLYEYEYYNDNDNDNEYDIDIDNDLNVAAADDAEPLADVVNYAESSFGRPLSPVEVDSFGDWLKTADPGLVKYAVEKSVLANVRNMSYVNAILRNWEAAGIHTPAEAAAEKPPNKAAPQAVQRSFRGAQRDEDIYGDEIYEVC